ncbi:DUF4384 domain-containing protein [Nannocystaceae bacterium ST9]
MSSRSSIPLVCFALAALAGCHPSSKSKPMDCDNGFAYDSRNFASKIDVGKFGGAEFESSKDAIRQVDQAVERYAQRWSTMCKEYNAGVIDKDAFNAQSMDLRRKMERMDELLVVLTSAPDSDSFQAALREAYAGMVPDQSVDLEVELAVMAQRPGESAFALVAQNAELPSGTKVRMAVTTSAAAHVYIYQVDPAGKVSVLFPDPRIPVINPVPGSTALAIPPAPASFTINEKDIGREQVHVVASTRPMAQLEASMSQAAANPSEVTASELECNARGLEYDDGSECPKSRGLVYDAGTDPGAAYSLKAVNAAADDAVHLVYAFDHSTG